MTRILPLDSYNLYLFHEGSHARSYRLLGAHLTNERGRKGVRFGVWAPKAKAVRVVGNFNTWNGELHSMHRVGNSGLWSLFIAGIGEGELYKYEIVTQQGQHFMKADPYAFYSEQPPQTASRIWSLDQYVWQDEGWQRQKSAKAPYNRPVNIYEVHLGSWRLRADGTPFSYRELADTLADYALDMGYTHLELMPVVEHPYGGSWGYQATGYFAVTSRYGTPDEFKYLVDQCHQRGIGVILDWVPGHFCKDEHGLYRFDGTPTFESGWVERGENLDWGTANFDFGRREVWSFLISNAIFWLEVYHIDGLRCDAVANMLYLDYGKPEGQWIPNYYGGNANLDAIEFLKKLNQTVFSQHPATLMIAEESTTWPMVTWPVHVGGLGFNFKWNMGWMNDMLRYAAMDPIYRQYWHNLVTFSFMYAFSENFVLPLSHDEVVHGKRSLLDKMPGDYWQKFANLRALLGYMIAHPGKKLLFMGGEFGQFIEWDYRRELDWFLLEFEMHRKLQNYVRELNRLYRRESCLWEIDFDWRGFAWIDPHDHGQSIISFMRKAENGDFMVVVCNYTPVVRQNYRVGVPFPGQYREIFNSDLAEFGGSGQQNSGTLATEPLVWHNQENSLALTIPPLAVIFLKPLPRLGNH